MMNLDLDVTAGLVTPAAAGNTTGIEPEFVRISDLRNLCGLKRGFVYTKIADGTFHSISLRKPGCKFGIRLVFYPSVKRYLHTLLDKQTEQPIT